MTDAAEWLAMIRDIVLLLLLSMAIVAVLILYRKVASVVDSAKRTMKSAEEIVSAVSDKVVKPATAGSGVASGAGKVAAFLWGFKGRRRKKGGSDDGQQ